jgi:hypothetical protein
VLKTGLRRCSAMMKLFTAALALLGLVVPTAGYKLVVLGDIHGDMDYLRAMVPLRCPF